MINALQCDEFLILFFNDCITSKALFVVIDNIMFSVHVENSYCIVKPYFKNYFTINFFLYCFYCNSLVGVLVCVVIYEHLSTANIFFVQCLFKVLIFIITQQNNAL